MHGRLNYQFSGERSRFIQAAALGERQRIEEHAEWIAAGALLEARTVPISLGVASFGRAEEKDLEGVAIRGSRPGSDAPADPPLPGCRSKTATARWGVPHRGVAELGRAIDLLGGAQFSPALRS